MTLATRSTRSSGPTVKRSVDIRLAYGLVTLPGSGSSSNLAFAQRATGSPVCWFVSMALASAVTGIGGTLCVHCSERLQRPLRSCLIAAHSLLNYVQVVIATINGGLSAVARQRKQVIENQSGRRVALAIDP